MPEGSSLSDYNKILRLTYQNIVEFMAVHCAADLMIPDFLADGTAGTDELASRARVNRDALERLMRVLARAGLCEESNGRFALTPAGRALRSGVEGSMRGWVMFVGSQMYIRAWERLSYSIRTGKAAFEESHGMPFFEYLSRHQQAQSVFDAAMTAGSEAEARAIVAAYDFSAFNTIVDIGGGHATVLARILKANPTLQGAVFEQEQVLAGARADLTEQGLLDRCVLIAGNFFDSVPDGYDAYLLKYIVHDWNDDKAGQILRTCRRAMSESSKLLLVENVNSANASDLSIISDLEMLVLLGGKERSKDEFARLLRHAGFELQRVVPTACPLSLIEAVPV